MSKYYLAYGSNLNLALMKNNCKFCSLVGTTELKDFRLVYKGSAAGYSYLTIEPSEGTTIPLGIYKISLLDEINLNKYEDYPELYNKQYINIEIDDKIKKAMIYVMNDGYDYNLPSEEYIISCMKGYDDFNFDKKILVDAYNYTKENMNRIKQK